MKRLLLLLALLGPFQISAQEISEYFQIKAAERVKQVLKEFESAFAVLTNPYVTDPDERADAASRMWASVRTNARFENDLVPQNKGSRSIDFSEYQQIASAAFHKSGLSLHFEWEQAEFRPSKDGYLALFYGTKSLYGKYQSKQPLRVVEVPCRAGIFVTIKDNHVVEALIGFVDTDMREKGGKLISLLSGRNPLEFVTLPETMDQLAAKIVRSLPSKGPGRIAIEELTFNGLGVSNDFSRQLTGMLRSSLTRLAHDIDIATGVAPGQEPFLTVKGSFAPRANFLRITAGLFDARSKPINREASAEILLGNLRQTVTPQEGIEPDAALLKEAERIRELTGHAPQHDRTADIVLEVGTDKGFGPQTYREGEIMKLKLRVNKPCVVRLIYRDAAGNLLRLRNDDFEMRSESVNRWIDIPERFQCAAPFGLETLFVYATTGTFRPLTRLRQADGFTFITEDLESVIGSSAESSVAKCIVPITTQPRRAQ